MGFKSRKRNASSRSFREAEIKNLVEGLVAAKREYRRLCRYGESSAEPGKPCSPEQIALWEEIVGKPMPPSYRAFLELHNGFDGFSGLQKLLSVEDQNAGWVEVELEGLGDLFEEFAEDDNPFEWGAIPVALGEISWAPVYAVFDPTTVDASGEMALVEYDLVTEQNRYKDFASFLRSKLETAQRLIEDKKG